MSVPEFKWNYADNNNLFRDDPESKMLVFMSPSDFIALAAPAHLGDKTVEGLVDAMREGVDLPIPFLSIGQREGRCIIISHEGRHRAEAAKRLGIEDFPVLLFFEEFNPAYPERSNYRYIPVDRDKQMCCACQPDLPECFCDVVQESWLELAKEPDAHGRIGAEIHGGVPRRVVIRPQEIDWRAVPDIAHATPTWRREHGFDF